MRALLIALLAAAPLASSAAVPGATVHVHQQDFQFVPANVTILVGDTVTWDNHDLVVHTVTADDGSFDSGDMGAGASYQRTFTSPATIPYNCRYHVAIGMRGTVIVSDPAALPDLAVVGMSTADDVPGLSKTVNITVRNLGLHVANASTTSLAYLYHGQSHPIGTGRVPMLGPGQAFSVILRWDTAAKVGDFDLRAVADSLGEVVEQDEQNNEGRTVASVLVPGVAGVDLLGPL